MNEQENTKKILDTCLENRDKSEQIFQKSKTTFLRSPIRTSTNYKMGEILDAIKEQNNVECTKIRRYKHIHDMTQHDMTMEERKMQAQLRQLNAEQ